MNEQCKIQVLKYLDGILHPDMIKAKIKGVSYDMYKEVGKLKSIGIKPNTVIDVGANIGEYSLAVNEILCVDEIYAFEPLSYAFKKIEQLSTKIPGLYVFNVAVGMEKKKCVMYENEYGATSSLLPISEELVSAFPLAAKTKKISVEMNTLNDVFLSKKLKGPVLLKIDVQGYEEKVLYGATDILKYVDYIQIELSFTELYVGQLLFSEMKEIIESFGFNFNGQIGEIRDDNTGKLLQIDAIFMKKK